MVKNSRKEREKEQFKAKVIQAAYELVKKNGIEALSLRKLATELEYSTTKLYCEFGAKKDIIVLLSDDICSRQNARLEALKSLPDPEANFFHVVHEAMLFYVEEPWTAAILGSMRFGNWQADMPPSFTKATENMRRHLVAMKVPEEHLEDTLNVMRALTLGALAILHPASSQSEKEFVLKIIDDGMRLIVRGCSLKERKL